MCEHYFRSGLFDDEDKATTVHCQARLPQISEEDSSENGDGSDASVECVSDDGSGFSGPTKSALTSYSMTSSVLPRTEKLTLLDDMFEKVVLSISISVPCFLYFYSGQIQFLNLYILNLKCSFGVGFCLYYGLAIVTYLATNACKKQW